MGRRISKEFLHPSILEGVNNKIGNLDSLETDAKGNMVQAINELVEKLDNSAEIENGKELIANAVGEPLTVEESFDEMSADINGLLSTFKTNMMNNGVTVESGDRFKSLIDKIATMVEEGEGKGIQFASGTCGVSTGQYIKVTDLGFTPSIIIVSRVFTDPLTNTEGHFSLYCPLVTGNPNNYIVGQTTSDSLGASEPMNLDGSDMSKSYISGDSFQIGTLSSSTSYQYNWVAIGVGEEDTTLRDSLASILEDEGVSVTEEDDMASLISKVDEEFENKNNTQFYEADLIADSGTKYPSLTSTGNARTFTISPGFTPKTIIMKAYTLSSKDFMYVISHFHTDSSNYASKSLQYAQNSSSYTDFYIWIDSFSAESVNCHIAVGDLDGGTSLSATVYIKIYAIA